MALCDTALRVFACFIQRVHVCLYFNGRVLEQDSTEIDFCVCMCLCICVCRCVRKSSGSWKSKTVDHTHY